jgi:hypothetical protein
MHAILNPNDRLTPAEMRLIRAYRQINDECQRTYLRFMEDSAEADACRRPSKNPGLRLVAGGPSHV